MPSATITPAPALRVHAQNSKESRAAGDYVLYWMTSARRHQYNFGLQHALAKSIEFGKPLLVFEALRVGYQWASDRHHTFVINGMADNAAAFAAADVTYLPYLEPAEGAGKGMFAALATSAVVVITDEFPCFFLPDMLATAAKQSPNFAHACDGKSISNRGVISPCVAKVDSSTFVAIPAGCAAKAVDGGCKDCVRCKDSTRHRQALASSHHEATCNAGSVCRNSAD
jgi:hypothetical protein